ncbi:MAG: LysM domain-containing protein [Phycisphaerales bacterium]
MTRENKLALIIGFTLILMVGVLVSDHLSRARSAQLDEAATTDAPATDDRVAFSGTLLNSAIEEAQRRGLDQAPPVATRIENTKPAPDPLVIQQGDAALATNEPAGSNASDTLTERFRAWADATETAWQRIGESAVPQNRTINARSATGSEIPSNTETIVPTREQLPRSVTHRVVAGDSLYKLAQRYLGNGNRWREIQQANPGRVSADGGLTIGVRLDIPILQAVDMPRETVTPRRSGPSAYVVRPGDTLGAIASELLGSSRRADEIVAANRGTIDDADEIRVGMKLTIPAR